MTLATTLNESELLQYSKDPNYYTNWYNSPLMLLYETQAPTTLSESLIGKTSPSILLYETPAPITHTESQFLHYSMDPNYSTIWYTSPPMLLYDTQNPTKLNESQLLYNSRDTNSYTIW